MLTGNRAPGDMLRIRCRRVDDAAQATFTLPAMSTTFLQQVSSRSGGRPPVVVEQRRLGAGEP